MSLRVAYNRGPTPLIASDDGRVVAAGSFGVVDSTSDAAKALLGVEDPVLRLLTPSELKEPGKNAPPQREDLVAAIAQLAALEAAAAAPTEPADAPAASTTSGA